ncbi:MAG: SUF system NifU family Fe-S cluster assembly protein [Cellulomonas sp.]|jgi:nitrogen fixation NifU-like protein|nr:SUF system NifU family Fe-S cluster assembly protein [Cellulomonas sp.]
MEQLYQQVILDHARNPHGRGALDPQADGSRADGAATVVAGHDTCSGRSHQVNPTCGDEVTLEVSLDRDGAVPLVADVRWEGQGCSISQASVSVLHDLVVGADLPSVDHVAATFRQMLATRGVGLDDDEAEDLLGDANAFTGVGKFPARVKCALLGWVALTDALVRTGVRGED